VHVLLEDHLTSINCSARQLNTTEQQQLLLLLLLYFLNPRKKRGWEKIKKNTKKFEVEKLASVVLTEKTVVQKYGVKMLNGNRNALK